MKRIILWLGVLLLTLTLPSAVVQATGLEELNDVTVHLKHQSLTEAGTTFSVYGLTIDQYEEALKKNVEKSVDSTKQWLSEKGIVKDQEVWVSSSNEAIFNVSKYDLNHVLKYYVILQNQPELSSNSTDITYEAMPSFISLDNVVNGELLIETKPINVETSIYFFKYSAGTMQRPLEGAEFAFYRLTSTNKKEYLTQINPVKWEEVNSSKALKLTSNKLGLVEISNLSLPQGTYYFEETKAPTGFSITENAKKVPVVVSESVAKEKQVTVNQETLNKKQAGQLPKNVLDNASPKVFNNPVSEKPSEPVTISNEPPRKGFLPQTGESLVTFTSLGLIMMIVAFGLMKRRKENE